MIPDGAGGFSIVDANGEPRFVIPTPIMWDSSGATGVRESETAVVATTVQPYGSDWLLTMRPDFAWLTAPERVYPVTVDPLLTNAAWTAESNQANGRFGQSVASP